MQVHHIHQETPDVWTISLLCHDSYPYRAGQYALVSVRNSADTLRAYTLSSTPGVSEYITLTTGAMSFCGSKGDLPRCGLSARGLTAAKPSV